MEISSFINARFEKFCS